MISEPSYYVGRPVESMQTMLRFAAEGNNRLLPVVPDGVFGPNTMAAVTAFQRLSWCSRLLQRPCSPF